MVNFDVLTKSNLKLNVVVKTTLLHVTFRLSQEKLINAKYKLIS